MSIQDVTTANTVGKGIATNYMTQSIASCIILGSSPRPGRPAPLVLNSTRSIDMIDEEDVIEPPVYADICVPSNIEPYVSAACEIVKHKCFGNTMISMPTPIISGQLFLGNASNAMDTNLLNKLGITAILNCATGSCLTNAEYYDEKIIYHEFDAQDVAGYDMTQHLDEALTFFNKCHAEGRPMLVHCAAGINRSAFIAVYLYMVTTGSKFVDAIRYCFSQRPIILSNQSFIYQLAMIASKKGLL